MKSKILLLTSLAAIVGLVLGLGSFTFVYGNGYSYFSDDPKACVNCHVMRDQYESWRKSNHARVATCNSCHTPSNLIMKYINKAENGFNHSYKFTFGNFKDPINIRAHNFDITMKSCLECHGSLLDSAPHQKALTQGQSCTRCHDNIGHTH